MKRPDNFYNSNLMQEPARDLTPKDSSILFSRRNQPEICQFNLAQLARALLAAEVLTQVGRPVFGGGAVSPGATGAARAARAGTEGRALRLRRVGAGRKYS